MLEPYQKKIVEMLYRQERLLARIYEKFAQKFPEHAEFWTHLAKEELKHAEWVKKLYNAEKKDLVFFDEGKVKTYTMQTIIEYTEKVLEQVDQESFTLANAIGYTLDFERSLVEKDVFKHFKTTSKDVRNIMERLESETMNHISAVHGLKSMLPPVE